VNVNEVSAQMSSIGGTGLPLLGWNCFQELFFLRRIRG